MSRKHLYRARQRLEDGASSGPSGLWQRMELRLQSGDEGSPLWPRLEERLVTACACPRLHPGLVLKPLPGAEGGYLLSDPARGRYFRLGEREASILSLLDGKREARDVARESAIRFGPVTVPAVERFLRDLSLAGLLDEGASLWQRLRSPERTGPLVLWTLPGADERIAALYRFLRILFTPFGGALVLVLFLAGLLLLVVRWPVLGADLALLRATWWYLPALLALAYAGMVPVVLTHELAHALACVHGGGRVTRFGLMVRHLLPAAFADVSDVWTLPRRARVLVFLAGPASTIIWAALATALWGWTPAGSWPHLLGGAVMLLSWYSALVGLVPVAGYDGSEVLAEWLEVPDLHRQALGLFRAGRSTPRASRREQRILRGYAAGFAIYNLVGIAVVGIVVWRVFLR